VVITTVNRYETVNVYYENIKKNITELFCISLVCPYLQDCMGLFFFFGFLYLKAENRARKEQKKC